MRRTSGESPHSIVTLATCDTFPRSGLAIVPNACICQLVVLIASDLILYQKASGENQ